MYMHVARAKFCCIIVHICCKIWNSSFCITSLWPSDTHYSPVGVQGQGDVHDVV